MRLVTRGIASIHFAIGILPLFVEEPFREPLFTAAGKEVVAAADTVGDFAGSAGAITSTKLL
jgi:hypothetical protein